MADHSGIALSETEQINSPDALAKTVADHQHLLASVLGTPAPAKDITANGGIVAKPRKECGVLAFADCVEDTVRGVDVSLADGTLKAEADNRPPVTLFDKPAQLSWNAALDELGQRPTLDEFVAAYPKLRDITKVKEAEWYQAKYNPELGKSVAIEHSQYIGMAAEMAHMTRAVMARGGNMTTDEHKFLTRVRDYYTAIRQHRTYADY